LREAIGLIETVSIAIGISVTDEMAKTADVEVLESTAICPGKYMVLIAGDVSSVVPHVHPQIFPAILGATEVENLRALGVVETFTVASSILAADAAAKAAGVTLLEIRLAKGLGGKGFFTMTGEVFEVEAAMDAALEVAKKGGNLVRSVVIPRPHEKLGGSIL